MSLLLTRSRVVLAKVESDYGEDAAPGGAQAMRVGEMEFTPFAADYMERARAGGGMGVDGLIPVDAHVALSFSVEMAGSGKSDAAPAWGALLKGCGMKEKVVGADAESDEEGYCAYTPDGEGKGSLTFYVHYGRRLHKMKGARGTVTARWEAGSTPTLRFSFMGLYARPTEGAAPAADFSAFEKPTASGKGGSSSVHGVAVKASRGEAEVGLEVGYVSFIGGEEVVVTDRSSGGYTEVMDEGSTLDDLFRKAEEGEAGIFEHGHGSEAGSRVRVRGRVQLTAPTYGDREGLRTLRLGMRFISTSASDELEIRTS